MSSVKVVPHEHFGYPQPDESCWKLVIQFPDDSFLQYPFAMRRSDLQQFLLDVEMKKPCSLGGMWIDYFRTPLIHYEPADAGRSGWVLHLNFDDSTFKLSPALATLLTDELTRVFRAWST